MILIIDNYDSFVYNLARYVALAGGETIVVRNDALSVEECLGLDPQGVIISPGPKAPQQAGICLDLLKALPVHIPLLGVCLGHQCLVEHFGGQTVRSRSPRHGRSSMVTHTGEAMFAGHESPLEVGRYHSLTSKPGLNSPLTPIATLENGELMAVRHVEYPWYGLQFHPESILTPAGLAMVGWFVGVCDDKKTGQAAIR